MEAQKQNFDWRTILLLIYSICGILFMLIGVISIQVVRVHFDPHAAIETSPLVKVLETSLMFIIAVLLVPAGWFSLQRLRNKEIPSFQFPKLHSWMWMLLVSIWLISLVLATLLYNFPGAGWFVPVFHFLSIAIPIYVYVYLLSRGITLGSKQRVWGVFGSGLLIGPAFSIVTEVALVLFSFAIVGIFLGFYPGNLESLQRTVERIQDTTDLDSLMFVIQPVARNPLTLLIGLVLFSGFVPLLEETFKSISVWLVIDKLDTPALGFALGAVSGAAFALLESLGASISPDPAWGTTLFMRAVSSMMHILAAGVVGWGIAKARVEKKYIVMIGAYLLGISIHSIWNAGVVFSLIGGMRLDMSSGNVDFFGALISVAGIGILFFMMTAMLGTLIFLSRKQAKAAWPFARIVKSEQGVK